ncbi:MAG: thiol peroxidase [Campylobacterales bacterium]
MVTTKLKGKTVNIGGSEVNVGDSAPEVTLVASNLSDKKIGGKGDKKQVLVAVPSLDTPVCAAEARKFNEKAASVSNAEVIIISMDLPFAATRFCTTEGIENLTVCSDFRNKEFAQKYGMLLTDGPLAGLTCRAILVIDTDGKVAYKQIVPEITEEPDYEDALKAL